MIFFWAQPQRNRKDMHVAKASRIDKNNHDTIGMVVVSGNGIVSATSTNGLKHKIAGRVRLFSQIDLFSLFSMEK